MKTTSACRQDADSTIPITMQNKYQQLKQRTVLVLGASLPLSGGIPTVIHDQLSSPLAQMYNLVLFDTRKRTRKKRTLVEGILAQLMLLTTYSLKLLMLRPDIVHIHAGGGNNIFRKGLDVQLAKMFRRRVLLHIHGGDFDRFFNPDHLGDLIRIQRIFQRCDGVVALSKSWRALYVRIVSGSKVHVVNNCVDLQQYETLDRPAARRRLDLPPHIPVVLHLGCQGEARALSIFCEQFLKCWSLHRAQYFFWSGPTRTYIKEQSAKGKGSPTNWASPTPSGFLVKERASISWTASARRTSLSCLPTPKTSL